MARIIVIGMGQGGLVASKFLAERGHQVTVYERLSKEEVGYDWTDDIDLSGFDDVGLPYPERRGYVEKGKWRFYSPDEKNYLDLVPSAPYEEVSIERKHLSRHLASLAEEAGATIVYRARVDNLLVRKNKVVGATVDGKRKECDLVIDCAGQNSPFREQIPSVFGVQGKCEREGVLRGYRAFFARDDGDMPAPECRLIVKHLGGQGISWCNINHRNEVDVLLARVGSLSEQEKNEMLLDLQKFEKIGKENLLRETYIDIGVHAPMAHFVADGYVACGDSAFMSMPLMGSGIVSSMLAGKMLADVILNNKIKDFSAKNLWAYQVRFYKSIGKDFALFDLAKNFAMSLPNDTVNKLFSSGVITGYDTTLLAVRPLTKYHLSAKELMKKLKPIFGNLKTFIGLLKVIPYAIRIRSIAYSIPRDYDRVKIDKWRNKYLCACAKDFTLK